MNKTTRKARKPPRKAKRETARDLRGKLETLQQNYDDLATKDKRRESQLRELVDLLRPFIEEIANECADALLGDHELFHDDHGHTRKM